MTQFRIRPQYTFRSALQLNLIIIQVLKDGLRARGSQGSGSVLTYYPLPSEAIGVAERGD